METDEARALKKALRQEMLTKRRTHLAERAQRSKRIVEHVLNSNVWQVAHTVAMFYPMEEEVDLGPLLTLAGDEKTGKIVLLPKMNRKDAPLDFYPYGAHTVFKQHRFGPLEPQPLSTDIPFPLEEVDLVLIPLLAFDCRGTRLGYGGGYYDRTLPFMKRSFRLGVAFHYQLLSDLPKAPWDISLHAVVTDEGLFEIPC
ncbi:MAG: 5-formyltetrahydrofolate cyclo-ligase [Candidatus Carbobacillus altaicus]|uniref:5-formyltetrahydrofolate cyclo-ligase n=1 Tax=Candidatus Carbonibacillus altaicus TaxID=2163959 RepID=A0A2R6Y0L1_9BACL|nr:MAG: 5-formyltetrahydrofolate cyclo-ligase [Candidatus Carbobacillus altaicus]